ncbi:MAG: hypothetical protein ABFD91_15910 [Anaerohalosphaeraceae bacterium]
MKLMGVISNVKVWENRISAKYPIKTLLTVSATVCIVVIFIQLNDLRRDISLRGDGDGEQTYELHKKLTIMQDCFYSLQPDISSLKRDVSSIKTDVSSIKKQASNSNNNSGLR